ncbi:cobalt ABC transporter ATP-binding protein [Sporomusaceae bacterium FL31]|nr:cobalt ABC transporter ATP-binding protein [Sporomusaceae bacterium FL31]GCE34052.1 cobalt ABC transporter ATP-binding protein [Sporomusaceae bacterium]
MEKILELQDVAFTYQQRNTPSVFGVSLSVRPGDFVLLTGATGCGKSTLLKMLNGLIPHESGGTLKGRILIAGQDSRQHSIAELSQQVGLVFQSPDDQLFSTTVYDETAFILENAGMDPAQIGFRVEETLSLVGLLDKKETSIHALSGGQKQRLAVASVLAARPKVLALDEPISQLDPKGAAELLAVLEQLNRQLGLTIILVEHRLHEVMPLCRRVVLMQEGQLVWQGSRDEAYAQPDLFEQYGLRMPQPVDICRLLGIRPVSAEVEAAVTAIAEKYSVPCQSNQERTEIPAGQGRSARLSVEVERLSFQYDPKGPSVLSAIDLTISAGQFVALMGNNGAGKSTLLQQLGGLLQPAQGCVKILGRIIKGLSPDVGMVLQNPDFMLFNSTVADEIVFALRQQMPSNPWTPYCHQLVEKLELTSLLADFPLALSRGQRLRVALAAVLASRPSVLLLDEPTTGQDIGHIKDIVQLLLEYTSQGGTVIFCTHDAEVAARYADRIVVLSQGCVVADGKPVEVFIQEAMLNNAGLKAPAALRVAQQLYNGTALTVEEVVGYVQQKCLGSSAG